MGQNQGQQENKAKTVQAQAALAVSIPALRDEVVRLSEDNLRLQLELENVKLRLSKIENSSKS